MEHNRCAKIKFADRGPVGGVVFNREDCHSLVVGLKALLDREHAPAKRIALADLMMRTTSVIEDLFRRAAPPPQPQIEVVL